MFIWIWNNAHFAYLLTPIELVVMRKPYMVPYPPQAANSMGVSALSHFRQPHLNQGIMECWPSLNIGGLSSLIPALAQKPRCVGKPDFVRSRSQPSFCGTYCRVNLKTWAVLEIGISMSAVEKLAHATTPDGGKRRRETIKRGDTKRLERKT